MSILLEILSDTQNAVESRRSQVPISEIKARVADAPPVRSLYTALGTARLSIIAEIKAMSPSAGRMNPKNVQEALRVYEDTPTISAISVLTEGPHFGGSLERMRRVRMGTSKPVLRKDFIVDEYQVWEARAAGADAILLMANVHSSDPPKLRHLYEVARSLGMDALVEIGMGKTPAIDQAKLVPEEARIWGINSRLFDTSPLNLRAKLGRRLGRDLTTVKSRHASLRSLIPQGKIAVAESGISGPDDLEVLVEQDYHAALIGTAFLKGPDSVAEVARSFGRRISELRSRPSLRAAASGRPLSWQNA